LRRSNANLIERVSMSGVQCGKLIGMASCGGDVAATAPEPIGFNPLLFSYRDVLM